MKSNEDRVFVGLKMPKALKEKLQEMACSECRDLSQEIIYILKRAIYSDLLPAKKSPSHIQKTPSGETK